MIRLVKSLLLLSVVLLITQVLLAQPRQGNDAFEIALPSLNGDTLKLSSLKGKVVLLDFWASWCGPCRSANKDMAKVYSKFKDKGFEIFSVSLDDSKNAWEKAVKKDKITWFQVNDMPGKAGPDCNRLEYFCFTDYIPGWKRRETIGDGSY